MIEAAPHDQKDLWGTPMHIYDHLNGMFHFTLDPCATKETAKCKHFFSPKENGLIQSWNGAIVFCNPPYSRGSIDLWVKKCFNNRVNQTIVALLPVSTSSDWFQKYCISQTKYWVDKRIKFIGAKHTAPFSSVIIHFNDIDQSFKFQQWQTR